MSVSHVLKRKLQIRVHRTWSTDHNRNQTIKNWSNYIEVMGIFHEFLPKPLTTLLGRHLLPLRLSHSLCSYVGELAPDIKSPCPSISSVSQAQHVPKDVMKMSTSQAGVFTKTTNRFGCRGKVMNLNYILCLNWGECFACQPAMSQSETAL